MSMDQHTLHRFVIAVGIAKNAGSETGRRDARRLATNIAGEAGMSFDEAFAALDQEDRLELAAVSTRPGQPETDVDEAVEPHAECAHLLSSADDDGSELRPGGPGVVDDDEQPDDHGSADAWQAPIASFVANRDRVTVGEVAVAALDAGPGRPATSDSRRIAACLERIGWRRERKNWRGQIEWRRAQTTTDHVPGA